MPTLTPEKLTANVNAGLDKLEAALPTIPSKVLHLQRAMTNAYVERTTEFWTNVADQTKGLVQAVRTGTNTVTGQARAAFGDVAKTAQTGSATVVGQARAAADEFAAATRTSAKTVAGQATAQTRRVAKTAGTGTAKVLDNAIDAVDETVDDAVEIADKAAAKAAETADTKAATGRAYEQRTKAELLERAKELNIEGRTAMSKKQLITALRA